MSAQGTSFVETGVLAAGVDYAGKTHKDFILRPQMVRDTFEVMEDERAQKNESYFGLCLLAKQIETLGSIPKKDITPELLMDLFDVDLKKLYEAKERLEKRLLSFREQDSA